MFPNQISHSQCTEVLGKFDMKSGYELCSSTSPLILIFIQFSTTSPLKVKTDSQLSKLCRILQPAFVEHQTAIQ